MYLFVAADSDNNFLYIKLKQKAVTIINGYHYIFVFIKNVRKFLEHTNNSFKNLQLKTWKLKVELYISPKN